MTSLLLTVYNDATKDLVKSITDKQLANTNAIAKVLDKMDTTMHVHLICDIVKHHGGGKKFIVEYNLPIRDLNILKELKEIYHHPEEGLFVDTKHGFKISNIEKKRVNAYDYDNGYTAYPYQRFEVNPDGVTWVVDFACEKEHESFLILFSQLIRVEVFDLLVPVDMICRNPERHGNPTMKRRGIFTPRQFLE